MEVGVTVECAVKHGKPFLVVQLDQEPRVDEARSWIEMRGIRILNIASPRESASIDA